MTWSNLRSWGRRHPDVVDVTVAVLLLALGAVSVQVVVAATAGFAAGPTTLPVGAWAAFGVLVGSLAGRRRWPLSVALVGATAFAVFRFLGGSEGSVSTVALFVALHAAGAYGRDRWRDVVRVVAVAGLMATLAWAMLSSGEFVPAGNVAVARAFTIALNLFFFGAAWMLGDLSRIRAHREVQLAARTHELEAERERNAARAVVEERVRIARELHDVLAHHVSLMGVQAGAARATLARDPERAAGPLTAIEASARSAVLELDRMLTFLRDADEPAGTSRAPQPDLSQLDRLADDVRRAGIPVELLLDDDLALDGSVQLSAYRIVQEALTNVLKHAGPRARATVTVVRRDGQLHVEIVDDGRGRASPHEPTGTGRGVVGMRERVALHGGRFRMQPRPDGGFCVAADLPLAAPAVGARAGTP